jgi:hypothetical protein
MLRQQSWEGVCVSSKTIHLMTREQKREARKDQGSIILLKGMSPRTYPPPARLQLLKFPPPPEAPSLEPSFYYMGLWGTSKIQTTVIYKGRVAFGVWCLLRTLNLLQQILYFFKNCVYVDCLLFPNICLCKYFLSI